MNDKNEKNIQIVIDNIIYLSFKPFIYNFILRILLFKKLVFLKDF